MYRFIVFQALVGILGAVIASKKGRNTFLWGLLCFIFPLLVFVIGFAPPLLKSGKTKQCPYCKRVLQETDTKCRNCGRDMPINLVLCRECGSFVPEGDYCMQCNRKLRE
jgi:RNA polymerase subunit RPABC4/transcription elongation factor Spt4